jgi:peroxiredoxin
MDAENFKDGEASLNPRVSVSAALAVSALAVFTIFITWRARVLELALEQPLNVHLLAPDFRATKMDGTPVSLSDFRGKKVVLTFWASWCGPCQEEMGALNTFYQAHHTTSSRFEILGVSIDEDVAQTARFAGEKDLIFPILPDPHETIARAYEEKGIPTLFVINEEGSIDYAHVGFDRSDRLEQILARDLGINLDRPMGRAR